MEYEVNMKCRHCGGLTILERMDDARYEKLRPILLSILHTLVCRHCNKQVGVNGGTIVKNVPE
jgi:phage FluMu protein Com